jgi:kinesin family protein 18/19
VGRFKRIIKVLDEHVLVFDPVNSTPQGTSLGSSGKSYVGNNRRAKDHTYAFDRVFDENSTQHEVYEHTTKNLIQTVLNGFNATVFAYGATGEYFFPRNSFFILVSL